MSIAQIVITETSGLAVDFLITDDGLETGTAIDISGWTFDVGAISSTGQTISGTVTTAAQTGRGTMTFADDSFAAGRWTVHLDATPPGEVTSTPIRQLVICERSPNTG